MQPASCRRPRVSTKENSPQILRAKARRLSNRSCERIATIRKRAASSRSVRLIWDWAMVAQVYRTTGPLSSPFYDYSVGLGRGGLVPSRLECVHGLGAGDDMRRFYTLVYTQVYTPA